MHPALGLIEVSSIARGMVVTDACVKKAEIILLESKPIAPGRYITLFRGSVAEVDEASREGLEIADDSLVDHLFLPGADTQMLHYLNHNNGSSNIVSLGVVETFSVAATLVSADAACKAAEVGLLEMRLATGLGGKSYYLVTGELHDVEAAVEAGSEILTDDKLQRTEIIPRPAADFTGFVW